MTTHGLTRIAALVLTLPLVSVPAPAVCQDLAAAAIARAHVAFEAARKARENSVVRAGRLAEDVRRLIRETQSANADTLAVEQYELLGALSGRVDAFLQENRDLHRELERYAKEIRHLSATHRLSTAARAIREKPTRIPVADETYPLERLHADIAARHKEAQRLRDQGQREILGDAREAIRLLSQAHAIDADLDVKHLIAQAEGQLPPWRPRIFFASVNQNLFVYAEPVVDSSSFVLYNRVGRSSVDYTFATPHLGRFDAAGWLRLWRGVAVGASVTEHVAVSDTLFTASVPSATSAVMRSVNMDVPNLRRTERAVHVELGAAFSGDRSSFAVFAGPSRIEVVQNIVSRFTVAELSGGNARVSPIVGDSSAADVYGVHLLLDGAWFFSPFVGVGASYRFTYADVDLPGSGGALIPTKLGGSNIGWGVRFRF